MKLMVIACNFGLKLLLLKLLLLVIFNYLCLLLRVVAGGDSL